MQTHKLKPLLQEWSPLFLISSLGLFFELAVVRWLSAEIRLLAYFKNLSLLAAFLGLAVGFALVGRARDYRPAFAPLLATFTVLVVAVGKYSSSHELIYPGSGDEFMWYTASLSYWVTLVVFLGMVLIFFLATVLLFIPLGQATGEEMRQHAPVPAYIVNLMASLAGIWIFSLLSFLQTPPVVWFGVGALGFGVYLAMRQTLNRLTVALLGAILLGLAFLGQGVIWSPYQRLEVSELWAQSPDGGAPIKAGYTLNIQQVFYQRAIDLSPDFLASLPEKSTELEEVAFSYNLPYRLGPPDGRILIVGAGMGNDVAAALRNQAGHVDAVEIDPEILALGQELHPEKPYADPRVTAIVDDARAFLQRSTDRYDVISFGLLDSHVLLSGLSSVRLDSFVYTLESFEQVRAHLTPQGLAVVSFANSAPWIGERLGQMLGQVFGPDNVYVHKWVGGTTFVAGPVSPDDLSAMRLEAWKPSSTVSEVPLATDDWPYIYLRTKIVPAAYWQALLVIAIACLLMLRRSFPQVLSPNWHFLLLGAAFLLVEFKSITEFALLFGSTWMVNVLAISGVLLMALAANVIVLWRPRLSLGWVYALLFLSLAFTSLFPLSILAGLQPALRLLISTILLSLPLFFAGLIFSESLRRAGETARPLASNLTGSVAGGIFEYASLVWGIKSLYIVAILVYAGAWLASRLQKQA